MTPRENCVLLLDLSLRCTGYCVVPWPPAIDSDNLLVRTHVEQIGIVPPVGEFKIERASVATQQRVGLLALLVGEVIENYLPRFVAAEMPANIYQSRTGASTGSMSSVQMQQRAFGSIMSMCYEKGIPFVEVEPQWSKQCLTGNRIASKRLVAENIAKRMGMTTTPGKPIRFPSMWKEASRDALAVLFFLYYRMNVFGSDWLNILLVEQGKPTTQNHQSLRGALYEDLMKELKLNHSALPTSPTPSRKPKEAKEAVVVNKKKTRKVNARYGRNIYPTSK